MVRSTDERAGTAEPDDGLRDDPFATTDDDEDSAATPAQRHLHELWQVLGLDDEDEDEDEEE